MSAPGNREVAHRLFAAEFDDAEYSYSESDEERAPNYVVSPTGARVNRLFVTGVLTEVSQAGDSILRARVVDPTGAFVVYAGQYQPEAMAFLDRTTPPAFVAVTGKARTFQPDDSDVVYTSVRPESISAVDADARDRWTVTAAERTLERIGTFAAALDSGLTGDALQRALVQSGVDESLATGIPIAMEQYGTTRAYLAALQETALQAVRHVTGDVEEVADVELAPDEGGDAAFTPAMPVDVDTGGIEAEEPTEPTEPTKTTETTDGASDAAEGETDLSEAEVSATDATPEAGIETPDPDADVEASAGEADPDADQTATREEPGDAEPSQPADTTATTEPPEEPADLDGTTDTEETSGKAGGEGEPAEPGEFEMDEETRREVEEEFGTDFSTGNEVAPAGEADIETPDPDSEPEGTDAEEDLEPDEPTFEAVEPEATDEGPEPEGDAASAPESQGPAREPPEASSEEPPAAEAGGDESGDDEPAEDVDLETALLDAMRDLDEGDGADREELVARVSEETGADAAAVEDAIQDALMSGQCYEPQDGRLTPI
ncbi:hypothetical protein [Halomarina litorea]|uniref:hypothetical protein n=1 Tax=Halomarina litorea TaxID=2961595 RepID=UPI0020C36EF8|nr:hypothetical protein [Halomarina sp. BCD28]